MYRSKGNGHQITVSGKTFWVDSNQEEVLIRWLENNGFHDRWRRTDYGIQVGNYRYTPDIEVSIQVNEKMTTRAIVDSKPTLGHLSADTIKRMRKTAKFYATDKLLIYTHDFKSWQRINIKTGEILSEAVPTPGKIPIDKLYEPWTRRGSKIWSHEYRQRLELAKRILLFSLVLIEKGLRVFVKSLIPTPRRKRRSYRRKRRN
jgi:hypothetical protein